MAVGTIADEFPISRPAISQHLRILKDARLVEDEADGNRRFYRLNAAAFASLREYFDRLWNEASKERVEKPDNSWRAW